ncbi:fumarylacetoacetate hydrolase family protein [Azohydromonas caseinilytica]|uniref:Fumarylacetoacetate hydrolase family protein n=1 Tax=Azohydromonas caseinilytica TaxID=2728836 RepID=A0A848FJ64_9BURK|nr:fumarylacetoacetate hydrolase family protein [Azohydromonas caseinilytica]NML18250.1 fumarylacetoacetate hydrolase family protein [Azohydromonas caseinilytica]
MKLASFTYQGRVAYGVVHGDQYLVPAADFLNRFPDLASVLRAGALADLEAAVRSSGTKVQLDAVQALPVIPAPGKIFCVGLNYKTHVAEMKRADADYPAIFVRFADSLIAAGDTMLRPSFSERFDYEGELAIVIGKGGRHIAQADAFDHIAGYACFNDGSVRDWQRHTHQWTPGKNFPGTGAFGPYMVTADEVGDVNALTLQTRLNGEVVQKASLSDLIFTIPVVIEYISRFTPLSPGDVIATGTPGGVGDKRQPPLYMKDGDVVEVEITGLGILRNPVGTAA